MKFLKCMVSCLLVCAASAVSAQTFLGTIYVGFSTTVPVTAVIYSPGTLASVQVVTGGATNLDFTDAGGGTCTAGTPYAAYSTCTIQVKFTPTTAGARYGAFRLINQDGTTAGGGYLQGTGTGPQSSFQPATQSELSGRFYAPSALAVDEAGNVYADDGSSPSSLNQSVASSVVMKNGASFASGSSFSGVNGVAVDGAGIVYTSATPGGSYILIPPDDTPAAVPFYGHAAVDGWGNIFTGCASGVCEETLQADASYVETTVASGLVPSGIAVDASGNVFVAAGALYKFAPVGTSYTETTVSSSISAAAVAVDGLGNVYAGDNSGNIYKETPQADGSYAQAVVAGGSYPGSLAADSKGDLYYFGSAGPGTGGQASYAVFEQNSSVAPSLTFSQTVQGNVSTAQVVTITNSGTVPLQFSTVQFPADFSEAANVSGECASGTSLVTGASCTLTILFSPVGTVSGGASALLQESVLITTNNGNNPGAQQAIQVSGTELARAPVPVFSEPGGVYYTAQTVTITDSNPAAKIYYTVDGSTPTTSSRLVTGPISVSWVQTLKAIAVAPGVQPSQVLSAYYALTAPTPVITPSGGTSNGAQTVTITTSTPIEAIFYTTAGNWPTTSSASYRGPITVSTSGKVIAFAAQTGFISSPFVLQSFTITPTK